MQALMFLAAITLGLCGIVFGLWEMRRNRIVQADYAQLREKRLELIDHIKNANREIAALKSEIATLSRGDAAAAKKKESGFSADSPLDDAPSPEEPDGFPVSFDNGSVSGKTVALTFDGGSHNNAAEDILDTLKSRGVKATVFVTGEFLRAYPQTIRRIVAEGHETCNHTFSHPHLTSWAQDHTHTTLSGVSEAFVCSQLSRTDSLFFSITGRRLAPLWRAPYGEKNRTICRWARRCGYLHVGWRQGRSWKQGLDSNDWIADEETPGFHSPDEVFEKIISLATREPDGIAGGIILMHLGTERKDSKAQVHTMLGKLIDELKRLGYTFVTVPEMLKDSGIDTSLLEKNRRATVAASPD